MRKSHQEQKASHPTSWFGHQTPRYIAIAFTLLVLVAGTVALAFPQCIPTNSSATTPHGLETPGREQSVSFVFEGTATIKMDGESLGTFENGANIRVRPGTHYFEVAYGRQRWQATQLIVPGQNVTIRLPAKSDAKE